MATTTEAVKTKSIAVHHLDADRNEFREKFDRASFEFRHNLADHPLFALDRLIELARETQSSRPDDLFYDAGTEDLNQRWSESAKPEFSAAEAVQRIEHCGA